MGAYRCAGFPNSGADGTRFPWRMLARMGGPGGCVQGASRLECASSGRADTKSIYQLPSSEGRRRKVLEVRFLRRSERFRRLFEILRKRRDFSARFLEIPLTEVEIFARFRRLFRIFLDFLCFLLFLLKTFFLVSLSKIRGSFEFECCRLSHCGTNQKGGKHFGG